MALKAFANGTVFADVVGAGAPQVLALHGWGRSHTDFGRVLVNRAAIAVDFPGFGASPPPNLGWGSAEYADSIRPIWEVFDEPPLVVAHSFGGRVAVHLAQDMPMSGLILIGVPLIRPPAGTKAAPLYRLARRLNQLRVVPDSVMERMRHRYGSADYLATSGVMREVFVRVVNESYEELLDSVEVPIRMLWGSNDTAAPVALAEEALRRLEARDADVEMRVLAGVGHDVLSERPEAVRDLMSEMLR